MSTLATLASRKRMLAVLALLLVFAIQLVNVARVYSANWDEAHHLYDGYAIWTKHDYRLNAEVPPLVKLTAALPLLAMHLTPPADPHRSQALNAFLEGRAFVFDNGGDRVLFPARMACLVFTMLLGCLIYLAGRSMFGTLPGLAALVLFIFDPGVLAHGTLISTDSASALFLFATVFMFYCHSRQPRAAWIVLTGVLAGFAMASKFTGILIVPILLCLSIAEAIRLRSLIVLYKMLTAWALGILIAWVVVWSFYGFRYAPAPAGLSLSPQLAPYLASMPHPGDGVFLAFLARHHLLPEAFVWGLANTRHTEWEYTSYFFGRIYRHGPWQYFPVAFLIKSTLPFLLLLALAPWLWIKAGLQKSRELIFLLVPVFIYVMVVVTSHFDIGVRHLLPVYPYLYLIAGVVAATAWRSSRIWAAMAILMVAWQCFSSLQVAPAYMAYGNEIWGGPLQVRNYLSDSNVDWGQQLKTVRQYLNSNHIQDCWFAYFPDGAVTPQDYGIPCRRLPTPSGLWWFKLPMEVPPVIHGTILISESDLDGVESGDGPLNPYESFRNLKPVAILEDGVYVYRGEFRIPLASAWVDVAHSAELAKAGKPEEALALAQQAVVLAPNSVRTQLNYADLLAARKDWNNALSHYSAAEHWLKTNRPEQEDDEFKQPVAQGLKFTRNHTTSAN